MATYQQLIAPSNYYRLNVSITQVSQDIVNNKSKIRVVGSITGMSSYATASWSRSTNSVTIDGASYAPTTAYSLSNGKTVEIFSYEREVSHASNGTKTVSVSWTFTGGDTSSSWNPRGTINCSQALTTIARASTASLSTSTVDYGGAFTVNIDRKSTSFTHTVTVKSAQGNTLTYTGVGTSQGVTIPTSWLGSFTSGSSTSGTVSVQTYSGSTAIGSAVSLGFTINVPRGSASLGSTSTSFGSAIRINISKANSTLSHYVTVSTPNRSTSFTTSSTAYDFTIPWDWLNGYTNGTSASGTITVQTKNGSTNIGSVFSLPFTCNVPSSVVPTISVSRTTFNSGLAGFNEPIQGVSTMTLTRTAGGSYSSSISKTEWWGDGISNSSSSAVSFTAAKKNPQYIYCKVTDSRGRTAQVTYTSSNWTYSPPSISSLTFFRCDDKCVPKDDGTYIAFTPTFSFTQLSGKNKLTRNEHINCSPAWNLTAETSQSASGSLWGPTGGGNILITEPFTFTFTITDSVGNVAKKTSTIPVAEVLMNFPAAADSVAFGQYSTKSKTFQVGWDAEFNKNIIGSLNISQSLSQTPTRNGSGFKVSNQPIPMTIGYNLSKDLVVGKPGLNGSWGHASIKGNPTAGGADIGLVDPGTEAPLSKQKINMVYSGLGLDSVVNFAIDGEFYFNEALDKVIGCTVITTPAGVAYRFTNGLMICIANRSFTSIVYSAVSGGYEAPYQVWSFPHAFNSVPAVIVNGDVGSTGWYESFWSDTQDGAKVHYGWTCKSNSAPPSSNVTKVQLVAIGNWKTPDF